MEPETAAQSGWHMTAASFAAGVINGLVRLAHEEPNDGRRQEAFI